MKIVAVDYETCLIQPGDQAPPAVVFGFRSPSTRRLAHARFDRDEHLALAEEALSADVLVSAHLAFDMAVMVREFPHLIERAFDVFDQGRAWDVLHAQKLIDLAHACYGGSWQAGQWVNYEYNVGALSSRFLGRQLEKEGGWRLRFGTLLGKPLAQWPKDAIQYLGDDVDVHWDLHAIQRGRPAEELVDVQRQTRASWWIYLMSLWGFRVDAQALAVLEERILKEQAQCAAVLEAYGLLSPGGKKNTKAAKTRLTLLIERHGVRPEQIKRTPTGELQLSEEALKEVNDPVLLTYARYASLSTIVSKDLKALKAAAAANMPIQSRFEVLADSGRTTSSGGARRKKNAEVMAYSYQLQNVRTEPGVRECFVPRPGYYLCSIDYSMFELHSWAQAQIDLIGHALLAAALNAGQDVHLRVGARLLGITYEEAVRRNPKRDADVAKARQMAKPANFGFPGGLGWRGFMGFAKANGVVVNEEQAQSLKREWENEWRPKEYFQYIHRLCSGSSGQGTVVQVRSRRIRAGVFFTEACNTFFQGLAADAAKDAGGHLARAFYVDRRSPAYGCRIVDFVHDEFLFEVPITVAHEASYEACRIMTQTAALWMPDCPPRAEPAIMTRWTKKAEAVFDRPQGRILPWDLAAQQRAVVYDAKGEVVKWKNAA